MTLRLTALAALLAATTMTAHAGVLTLDGVTFTSSWSGNVLTLEIDAAKRSGGWSGATGLAALAIKGVGSYSSVSVSGGPGGTDAWKLSTSELKASGCSGTSNGAAGSRMCFYGQQIALADDMVFKFTFAGASVATNEPHVKVEFVNAQGTKVGSLLSQVLPASTASTTPSTPTAPVTPVIPVTPVVPAIPDTPTTSTGTQTSTTADTKTPAGTLDVASPSGTPAGLPPQEDLPSTLPVKSGDVVQTPTGNTGASANVPEPESIALLLGGLGLMGLVLRRRPR
ncbi:PEP-CTERM sorting domain-containing protein [Massilia kyonggiensis]|nr:PEP-CTERM sorting domain-containing protein [Massilia kyonggiensis]